MHYCTDSRLSVTCTECTVPKTITAVGGRDESMHMHMETMPTAAVKAGGAHNEEAAVVSPSPTFLTLNLAHITADNEETAYSADMGGHEHGRVAEGVDMDVYEELDLEHVQDLGPVVCACLSAAPWHPTCGPFDPLPDARAAPAVLHSSMAPAYHNYILKKSHLSSFYIRLFRAVC